MDKISHVCVGYLLMIPTHHDGRFFPTTYLDHYGINLVIKEIAFQCPMKFKDKNMIWEDASLHGKGTKIDHDERHPHLDEWVWMEIKKLVSYLQIYDTR